MCQVALFSLSILPYSSFVSVLLLVLCFLYSFGSLCLPGCLGILYMWRFFFIYTKDRLYASKYTNSTGDVLKATVYIFIPSLCMLLSFILLRKLCCIVGSHSLIYMLHYTGFFGLLFTFSCCYHFDVI